jgi:hypothetical protein
MADRIRLTLLRDGSIKTETDDVSAPNHANADAFLANLRVLQGGPTTTTRRTDAPAHTHDHDEGHTHTHDGYETHTH